MLSVIIDILEKAALAMTDFVFGGRLSTLDNRTKRTQRAAVETNWLIRRAHDMRQQELLNSFLREHDK
nr:hypothetical protein [uncultured Cohaesibacter sp.]